MTYSAKGVNLTKRFELCAEPVGDGTFKAYFDPLGSVWTCGWGSTGLAVTSKTVWSQAQCDAQLAQGYGRAEANVNRLVNVPLTQSEFDALVDFEYNLGERLAGSTMLFLLNKGDVLGAAKEFEKWDHAGGKEVSGLLRRRLAEEQEFLS